MAEKPPIPLQNPDIHEVTAGALEEISHTAGINPKRPEFITNQSVVVGGEKHTVDITTSKPGKGELAKSNYVQTAKDIVDERGRTHPSFFTKAELGQQINEAGEPGSRATVNTEQGRYVTIEGSKGSGSTRVERPGYGDVEIKDPRAKVLVAKLAAKSIKDTQGIIKSSREKRAA